MRASGARTALQRQPRESKGVDLERGSRGNLDRRHLWRQIQRGSGRPVSPSDPIAESRRALGCTASKVGSFARIGCGSPLLGMLSTLAALGWIVPGCARPAREAPLPEAEVATAAQPEGSERYCAWYGDARGGLLYFGESAFWSAERAHADPLADRLVPGPRRIGRFDLSRRRLLAPLDAGSGERPTGVWDVLAHPNGRVYFTTWFDSMGFVDAQSGEVRRLEALGRNLNEIAPGPGESLLVSRYGSADGGPGDGSVLVVGLDGERVAELPLAPPAGYRVAPKTVGFDPARDEIWVTTDLFPSTSGPIRHDAYVLDRSGREKQRTLRPELHFVAFGPDGTGLLAEVDGTRLVLRVRPPAGPDRRLLADDAFAAGLDFAQDIHFAPDGRAVVTRWSGVVHVFDPPGSLTTLRLPPVEPAGLYYSGVLAGDRVCATHCGGLTVVCAPLPAPGPAG